MYVREYGLETRIFLADAHCKDHVTGEWRDEEQCLVLRPTSSADALSALPAEGAAVGVGSRVKVLIGRDDGPWYETNVRPLCVY